ncbi:helix-turn-helix domain-containing protein [Paenibacillus sp. FA6]|uniref:helix-turn-helix domain-containing protein n=1 Tax=Paenibacillus sp. FA6 TaxID=3413029 RepID=UPI003F65F9DA
MVITLRAARVNSGMTLMRASSSLGINKDTLSRYERDSADIPRSLLVNIQRLYGVNGDNIFFGCESEFFRTRKMYELIEGG